MNYKNCIIKTRKNVDLQRYRRFTITPTETSCNLPLNYNDLTTDNALGKFGKLTTDEVHQDCCKQSFSFPRGIRTSTNFEQGAYHPALRQTVPLAKKSRG